MDLQTLDFLPVFLTGFALKLLLAAIGYFLIRFILNGMDKILNFNFKEWINDADDLAKGIYLGFRILSICIFVAWVIS